ncbi:MAG: LEPR-XLL domain-containing protein, partial [Ancalomicrobiaceae bacterium]|nr:LEPR-XLL domain-containing protein [Ancalomicrobiaceae bacterium]
MSFPFQSTGLFGWPRKARPNDTKRRARTPRWLLRLRERIGRTVANHERIVFDPLEPRLLLNADVLSLNLAHDLGAPPADHSLLVQLVQVNELVNHQSVSVQRIQIVDQNNGGAVLTFGDLGEISSVSIVGGSGHDSLTVDAKSFAGTKAPTISFSGGNQQDTVIFDTSAPTQWTLTGADSGAVSGGGVTVSFQHVGNLVGAGGADNTLTVEAGGALTGVFDGGVGGHNALVFDNGPHVAVATSIGPAYDTISLDGTSLNYAHVGSVEIGDPAAFDLSGTANRAFELQAVTDSHGVETGVRIFSTDGGSSVSYSMTPTSSSPFEITLGSGDTLKVDTINFDTFGAGALIIDGSGASIEFAGTLTDSAGVSAAATSSHTSSITDTSLGLISVAAGSETITAPTMNASIVVDSSASIVASTISLSATASSTESITSATDWNLIIGAGIATIDTASVTIAGTLNATGAVSAIANVAVNDNIALTNAHLLHSVSVSATNSSTVSFVAGSSVTAGTLDAEANTTVSATVAATNLGIGYIPGVVPLSIFDAEATANVTVTNVTSVAVAPSAAIDVGSGQISTAKPVAAYLAATDQTTAATTITLASPFKLPVVGNVLAFSALDSTDTLSRTTSVDVGNDAATSQPSLATANTLYANGGDIALAAANSGAISNDEISTSIGSVEIGKATPSTDTATVEVAGVNIAAGGLALNAVSNTSYEASGHLTLVAIQGGVDATVSQSALTVGTDGLVVNAEDDTAISASAVPPSFDPTSSDNTDENGNSGTTIAFSRSSAIVVYSKSVASEIVNSTVASGGTVTVRAVDATTIDVTASMSADATTSKGASVAGGGSLAVTMINSSVGATIDHSKVTTTGASSDVQVLAGDESTITSSAETSATSSGTSTSASVSGTVALNAIGWSFDTSFAGLAKAALGTLLGTDSAFWTNNAPTDPTAPGTGSSNVTASITHSTVAAGGALLVSAVAAGTVRATVSNISTATSTANGNGTAVGVGGIIGSNRVSRAATAFVDALTPVSGKPLAGGAVTISAKNTSTITSSTTLVTGAISSSADAKTTYKSADAAGNASNSNANLKKTTTLKFGDTVLFKASYTTENLFGTKVAQDVALKQGDTVYVAPTYSLSGKTIATSQVYQYIGPALANGAKLDLETQDYSDTSRWKAISALQGAVYRFMGANNTNVDLSNGSLYDASGNAITTTTPNYYDLGYWMKVPKAELTPASENGATTSGSASGVAAGGVVVLNMVDGGAYAIVKDGTTITSAALSVSADDAETINATLDSTATTEAGSSFGSTGNTTKDKSSGTSLAVNGAIAINEILGNADAHIVGSSVTTTTGDVSVTATNASDIEATTSSAVTAASSGGTTVAVGIIMADNTIGAGFQDLLDSTIDTIAGGSVLGSSAPTTTTAYVLDSSVTAGGALTVSA